MKLDEYDGHVQSYRADTGIFTVRILQIDSVHNCLQVGWGVGGGLVWCVCGRCLQAGCTLIHCNHLQVGRGRPHTSVCRSAHVGGGCHEAYALTCEPWSLDPEPLTHM